MSIINEYPKGNTVAFWLSILTATVMLVAIIGLGILSIIGG